MRKRKVQREDRRRRVLRDESGAKSTAPTRSRSGNGKLQLYIEHAVTDAQPRVTDCVPRRRYFMCLWLLVLLLPVTLVQALAMCRQEYFSTGWIDETASFNLIGAGTIATWLSSMLLMLASGVAVTIYLIRQHKLDDYRGRYRIWLWVAGWCAFLSLDTVAAVHRPIQAVMIYFFETRLWGDGAVWWMLVFGAFATYLSLRVLWDIRRSAGSIFFFLLSVAGYVAAGLFSLRVWRIGPTEVDTMAYIGSLMTAHAVLVFSLLVYARFVYRVASGETAAKPGASARSRSRSVESRPKQSDDSGGGWFRRRKKVAAADQPENGHSGQQENLDDVEYEEVDEDDLDELERLTNPNLSKADQRKLRKKKRQQRRAA